MSSDQHDTNTSDELDPDEPRTPLWLPLLGLGMFLVALTYFLVSDDEGTSEARGGEPSQAQAAPQAPGDTE